MSRVSRQISSCLGGDGRPRTCDAQEDIMKEQDTGNLHECRPSPLPVKMPENPVNRQRLFTTMTQWDLWLLLHEGTTR